VAATSRYGIEFTDVAPEASARLHQFLETLEHA
jgi:hypothetical protein